MRQLGLDMLAASGRHKVSSKTVSFSSLSSLTSLTASAFVSSWQKRDHLAHDGLSIAFPLSLSFFFFSLFLSCDAVLWLHTHVASLEGNAEVKAFKTGANFASLTGEAERFNMRTRPLASCAMTFAR